MPLYTIDGVLSNIIARNRGYINWVGPTFSMRSSRIGRSLSHPE